ncbi:MAG TPA: pyruvate kinase [Mycobacteriales bacterium]|nr:pyruvate kinase [Mycobacteriales bacterium]
MTHRAKIVCTLGPATDTFEAVIGLVEAGMNVAWLNLSHGTLAQHASVAAHVRAAAGETGQAIGVLADLQGPKIRLGRFAAGEVPLETGDEFTITTEDVVGDARQASTTYAGLPSDVRPGECLLVDDGRVALQVTGVDGPRVHTRVLVGGVISNGKGLNVPGTALSVPALSDKDAADLRWALRLPVDMVALSFVRGSDDLALVDEMMDAEGVRVPVLAKLEKPQAVARLPEIVEAFDGIMVARGDLGVELPLEQVPVVQKRAATLAREAGKPVIVATQMLESMINAPRPTRAEASDVANAVLDGADALMLSGETSVGHYPRESVQTMAKIIETTEAEWLGLMPPLSARPTTLGGAIARASSAGAALDARALVAFTQTGDTARRLARFRSPIPMLAFTPVPEVRNQLALTWGMETLIVPPVAHTDDMVAQVDNALLASGRFRAGDLVVIVAGSPPGQPGNTNMLRLHRIGEA